MPSNAQLNVILNLQASPLRAGIRQAQAELGKFDAAVIRETAAMNAALRAGQQHFDAMIAKSNAVVAAKARSVQSARKHMDSVAAGGQAAIANKTASLQSARKNLEAVTAAGRTSIADQANQVRTAQTAHQAIKDSAKTTITAQMNAVRDAHEQHKASLLDLARVGSTINAMTLGRQKALDAGDQRLAARYQHQIRLQRGNYIEQQRRTLAAREHLHAEQESHRAVLATETARVRASRNQLTTAQDALKATRASASADVARSRGHVHVAQRALDAARATHAADSQTTREQVRSAQQRLDAARAAHTATVQNANQQMKAARDTANARKEQFRTMRTEFTDHIQMSRKSLAELYENHRAQRLGQHVAAQHARGIREITTAAGQAASHLHLARRAAVQMGVALGGFASGRGIAGLAAAFPLKALDGIAQAVGGLLGPVTALGQTISGVIGGIGALAGDALTMAGKVVGGTVALVASGVGSIFSFIGGVFSASGGLLAGLITGVATAFLGPGAVVVATIAAGLATMVGGVFDKLFTGIGSAISSLGGLVGGIISGVAQFLGEAVGKIAGLAGQLVGGAADRLLQVSVEAIQVAARFEQTAIALEAMTGSADKAKAVMEDLVQFAAVTPFRFTDLTKGVQRLTATGFGIDEAVPIMKRLGNLAAAMPEGMETGVKRLTKALGDMRSKGVVMSQEMRQLAEANVPAWEMLAQHLGVSVPEAMRRVEARSVTARQGILAILEGAASPKFAGMMAMQSQTVLGLWSTLKDNLEILLRDVGVTLTESLGLKGAMSSVTGLFDSLRARVQDLKPALTLVGTVVRQVFDMMVQGVQLATNALADWTRGLDASPEKLQAVKLAVIDAFEGAGKFVIKSGALVVNAIIDVINKVWEWKDAFDELIADFSLDGMISEFKDLLKTLGEIQDSVVFIVNLLPGVKEAQAGIAVVRQAPPGVKDAVKDTARNTLGGPLLAAMGLAKGLRNLFGKGDMVEAGRGPDATDAQGQPIQPAMPQARIPMAHIDPAKQLADFGNLAQGMRDKVTFGPFIEQVFMGIAEKVKIAHEWMKHFGIAAKENVNLKLDPLNDAIQKMVKETRTPLQQVQDEIKEMNDLIALATPGAFRAAGQEAAQAMGGIGAMMAVQMRESEKAIDAIQKSTAKKVEEILKKQKTFNDAGSPALLKGSQEAASAMNRAINASKAADPAKDLPAILQGMMGQDKERNKFLADLLKQAVGLAKNLGVGPGI